MQKFKLKPKRGKITFKTLEADSCPNAWLFYNEIYKDDEFFNKYNTKIVEEKAYWNCSGGLNIGENRLIAKLKVEHQNNLYFPFEIGGDCIFNFSSKVLRKKKSRLEKFEELLKSDENCDRKKEYLEKLEKCKIKHHSNENFSIMPITGGLNIYKGTTRPYLESDRADVFISHVKSYYELKIKFEVNNIELRYLKTTSICDWNNGLNEYFLYFENFNNWISATYHIDIEKECKLVDELIRISKVKITGNDDLLNLHDYIDVALKFWEARQL